MNLFHAATISGYLGLLGTARAADPPASSNLSIVAIAGRIRAQADGTKAADIRSYTNRIPGTKASYAMIPIPGGEFVMGSPAGSRYAKPEELPPHRVRIEPFWMGRCEVTWNEFDSFVYDELDDRPSETTSPAVRPDRALTDAVTHPTLPYVDMAFGMGKSGYPAISMTQHAANKYCQWLSAKTGHFYRLPTEAEWEYAARAGSTNTWFFGDDEAKLANYAWFEANSDFKYQKVGGKLSNPWGLHDMLGNVSEWVLDQFDEGYYKICADGGTTTQPWNKAAKPYPHSVRGGAWSDPMENVRCAARGRSDPKWKIGDPQFPRSLFWLRNCDFVGFRIARPLAIPTTEEMRQYWNSGVERD
jgi:formylglycine-generating enzyme required for sulfatase activity